MHSVNPSLSADSPRPEIGRPTLPWKRPRLVPDPARYQRALGGLLWLLLALVLLWLGMG